MEKEKKKVKRFGALPINCRIDIDYTNGKPKIKFGYPHKKQQRHLADHTGPHVVIAMLIYVLISVLISFLLVWEIVSYFHIAVIAPTNCTTNFTYTDIYQHLVNGSANYTSNKTVIGNQVFEKWSIGSIAVYNRTISGMNVSCNNNISQSFDYKHFTVRDNLVIGTIANLLHSDFPIGFQEKDPIINPILTIVLGISLYSLMILWIIGLWYFTKYFGRFMLKFHWYQKTVPEWNKKLSGGGYYKVIKEVPANKIVELPLFKNIYLDYNVKGEFSKYLKKVEIREHPFYKGVFKKGKLKKKKGNNYMLWYARFYFSEIPKNGELIIWWK